MPAEQRALDEWAIGERGIPGVDLMERAGTGLADLVGELAPAGRIVAVCGKGNNGGDGLVAARLLRDARARGRRAAARRSGRSTRRCADQPRASARGRTRRRSPSGRWSAPARSSTRSSARASSGEPRDPAAGAIAAINDAGARATGRRGASVIACDVPSGVDASTGEIAGVAVQARATATFHAAKPGLWIAPGKTHAGEVAGDRDRDSRRRPRRAGGRADLRPA